MRQFLRKRRWTIAAVTAALAALAAILAVTSSKPSDARESRPNIMPVAVVVAKKVDSYERVRRFTGLIVARRQSDLSFERTSDKITAIFVDEGDEVEQGQKLAQLDSRQLVAKKRQLLAQRDEAAAVLRELKNGPRKEKVAAAKSEVEDFRARVNLAEADYRRQDQLRGRQAASQDDFDRAIFNLQSLKASLEAAKWRYKELERGTRQEKIDAQKGVVAQLDAAIASIDIDLDDSILTAPYQGKIAKRHVDEGTIVTPQTNIMRLVENKHLEARIGIPAFLAHRLEPGQTHPVVVEDVPHDAVVKTVSPELDRVTRTRTAILTLNQNAASRIVPGQIARLRLNQQTDVSGFWLPSTALMRGRRGLWSAYAVVQEDSEHVVERRDLEVLYSDGKRTLVRGTLQNGDLVIVSGTHRVAPAQTVAPHMIDDSKQ